ncbi:MAG: hypothetical protein AB8F26_05170 [Phycisphaerales bacterium]
MSTAPRWPISIAPDARLPAMASSEDRHPTVIRSVLVTWRVTRSAIGESAPSGSTRMLCLQVSVDSLDDSPTVSVAVVDPSSDSRNEISSGDAVHAEVIPDIRGEFHIEVPGWLHITMAYNEGAGDWRLLYARTPMLEKLSIPGGRAEPTRVDVG